MNLSKIFDLDLSAELAELEKSRSLTLVNVGNTAAKSFLISKIAERTHFQNIFWASGESGADALVASAELFFGKNVAQIPSPCHIRDFYRIRESVKNTKKNLFLFEDLAEVIEENFPSETEIKTQKITLETDEKIEIYTKFSELEKIGYSSADDLILNPGEFARRGENLLIFPIQSTRPIRISLDGDKIEEIAEFEQNSSKNKKVEIFPASGKFTGKFIDQIQNCQKSCVISDDLDTEILKNPEKSTCFQIKFTAFPPERAKFFHLNFFSVLPFYTIPDFITEIKERLRRGFSVVVGTKKFDEIQKIFRDNKIMFSEEQVQNPSTARVIKFEKTAFLPHSFQNSDRKILFLTDREIFRFHRTSRQKKAVAGVNLDLMTSLKPGDFVVHLDHGLAQFDGIVRRKVGTGTREYLKLKYAENDKLFIPVESAEKITKFIGDDDPKLSRIGSNEWQKQQKKIKAETERIAKELLKLYATRELAKGAEFPPDDEMMRRFCDEFPYEMTPGQQSAWDAVRRDLEKPRPMDRLVCGDVGFGKTEIAMRAAFKTFRAKKQCVILAPITILAEQHFQSLKKRISGKNFGVKIALLSRFQSPAEQKIVLRDLELGLIDIVVGTHRLLSADVKFKNLGCVIIDEEQRFGVAQKEKLKKMRASVHILTLTATPIPRTLNMSLGKLKEISTITTPPPGRLPIVTEVRKYNLNLIRERILAEKNRGGQIYFLHNQVKTIEATCQQFKSLVPECKFIVAHGQLTPAELESRIRAFKNGEADVLIASTIIENGIDLPNANTLIVNRAEKFGLSQLHQLRGRVGRSRVQAYAYFLYHGQKLELEAKKRLRAIVEASELGSGFQIAMRDLEIRGAGEILGVSQAGAMKTVGISHFMRVLNQTVEKMKSGEIATEIEEEEIISVEIPLSAYIPSSFISDANEKIQTYKELASAQTSESLADLRTDLREDFGALPTEVENLFRVLRMKIACREANLSGIKIFRSSHRNYEIVLRMGKKFTPDQLFELVKNQKLAWSITAEALKMRFETLPINWYEIILEEILKLKKQPEKPKKTAPRTKK